MSKCWIQYLKIEKINYSYCSFCGCKYDSLLTKFKMNCRTGKLGSYCPECWEYEFPNGDMDKRGGLMTINYDCNGRLLDLNYKLKNIDIKFDVNQM